ncbi:TPA: helix-turn-helix domain-containing protein [Mannheimia haemolytica]|nr:helix-turn-helix domain-containing protein [Mannheimia haemolytica]
MQLQKTISTFTQPNHRGIYVMTYSEQSYLNVKDVCEMLQLNRSTIYRHIKQGIFPKPTKIGKSSRWKFADIKAFLEPKPQEAN